MKLKDLKTGQILLVNTKKGFVQKTIHWFQSFISKQGSKWNHAAMIWIAYSKPFVIEADRRGICITPLDDYFDRKKYELLLLIPSFDVDGSAMGKFMLPFCGHTRYDYFNLLFAQPVEIISDGEIWIGGKQNNKKFICGEWCYFVFKHFFPKSFSEQPEKISPVELFENYYFRHDYIEDY